MTQTDKCPLPAMSRHAALVTGQEPGPQQTMQLAGLWEVTSEAPLCQVRGLNGGLDEGGDYLFGILPGTSVSSPRTSFM